MTGPKKKLKQKNEQTQLIDQLKRNTKQLRFQSTNLILKKQFDFGIWQSLFISFHMLMLNKRMLTFFLFLLLIHNQGWFVDWLFGFGRRDRQ